MSNCENKKLNDKGFIKQYGETTCFSYGCEPTGKKRMYGTDDRGDFAIDFDVPQSECYVYRMTMTNEDGFVVEYTPDFMRYRCEQMGIKTVPVFSKFIIPAEVYNETEYQATDCGAYVQEVAEQFYDGPDPVGQTHVREGVVVRILNRPKFCAYKAKCFEFKVLENLIKDLADAPDMEEAQEILDEVCEEVTQ